MRTKLRLFLTLGMTIALAAGVYSVREIMEPSVSYHVHGSKVTALYFHWRTERLVRKVSWWTDTGKVQSIESPGQTTMFDRSGKIEFQLLGLESRLQPPWFDQELAVPEAPWPIDQDPSEWVENWNRRQEP